MENTGLQNFMWIGGQLINLAYIVRFVVEDEDTRVTVYLSNTEQKDATVTVDGDAAVILMNALSEVALGKGETQAAVSRIGIIPAAGTSPSAKLPIEFVRPDGSIVGVPSDPNATGQ